MKRRLEAAEAQVQETKNDVATIRNTLQLQQMSSSLAASTSIVNNTFSPPWDEAAAKNLGLISDSIRESGSDSGPNENSTSLGSLPTDSLKIQILAKFEELTEILGIKGARRNQAEINHGLSKIREYFLERHGVAFASVRALRNGIAHAEDISREEVVEGLTVLDDLRSKALVLMETSSF